MYTIISLFLFSIRLVRAFILSTFENLRLPSFYHTAAALSSCTVCAETDLKLHVPRCKITIKGSRGIKKTANDFLSSKYLNDQFQTVEYIYRTICSALKKKKYTSERKKCVYINYLF